MVEKMHTVYSEYMGISGNKQFANRKCHEMPTLTQNSVAAPVAGHLAGFLCGYFWQKTVHQQKTAQNTNNNRIFLLMIRQLPISTLNPFTTLFRSYIWKE